MSDYEDILLADRQAERAKELAAIPRGLVWSRGAYIEDLQSSDYRLGRPITETDMMHMRYNQFEYDEDFQWRYKQHKFIESGGILPPGKTFRDVLTELTRTFPAHGFHPMLNSPPPWFTQQPAPPPQPPRRVRRAAAKAAKKK